MQGFDIHTLTPRARRLALAATAALALAGAAPAAFGQPGGGMMHGMHRGGSIDQMVPHLLEEAKASLNLSTLQQGLWNDAVAQSKLTHEKGRANRQRVKDAVKTQLAQPEPDLAAIAAAADAVEQENRLARQSVRAQWLALYATFTHEQKAVVRDLLQKRVERAETFRERMKEHFRGEKGQAG
jgi:Spy/CpxP family protein refolding chaperone